MDQFEFNVPRFTAFNSCSDSDEEEVEKYFDFDHECEDQFNSVGHPDGVEGKDNDEAATGLQTDYDVNNVPERETSTFKTPKKTPRKSEYELLTNFSELSLTTPRKLHAMETRLDCTLNNQPLVLRTRSVLRMSVAPEKVFEEAVKRKRKHSVNIEEPEKYICMAEAVEKFHKVTPARFHTRPRNEKFHKVSKAVGTSRCTIPMSPHLKVIHRNRPNHALSRKQLEDIEVEEMKKHQVKARPINEKIFKPPSIDCSHRSFQVTEFKPFNLTEFKKKVEEPRPSLVKFTARPVPKGLFKKVDVKNTSAPSLTHNCSDWPVRLRVPAGKRNEKENKIAQKPVRKGPVTTAPFSFYDRDMMLLKKKEEKIKQVLEEEKKAHTFHANPPPKFPEKPFQEKATIIPTIQQPFRLSADDKGKANREKWEKKLEEEKMMMKKAAEFKAKPPVVLTKKPFVPLKTEKHEFQTLDIHLNTEIRAKERALYDLKMQMKLQEIEELKMQRQREREQMEEDEAARIRKEMVHKANPIRHYKEMIIQPANKKLTLPMSPKSFIEKSKLSNSEI
ncbi:targeting protein for Xklp2-like [Hetaerina americana]|uniref:targeting protein for Xklp2-like n=1 Tax=Hetaerina americana TaxID=62018 RepID=UPI003A7F56FC